MPSLPLELSEDEERAANLHSDQKWMFGGLALALLMILSVGWIYWQFVQMQSANAKLAESSARPSMTPSPSVVVSTKPYPVKVLNGSGVTGLAAKYKKQLEQKDPSWRVETGNSEIMEGVVVKYPNQAAQNSTQGLVIKEIWPKASEKIDESLKDSIEIIIGK